MSFWILRAWKKLAKVKTVYWTFDWMRRPISNLLNAFGRVHCVGPLLCAESQANWK